MALQSALSSMLQGGSAFDTLGALTEVSGLLHPAQIRQLKLYGLAMSRAVAEATLQVDVEGQRLTYVLRMDPAVPVEADLGKRVALLKKAGTIITRGWLVDVKFDVEAGDDSAATEG